MSIFETTTVTPWILGTLLLLVMLALAVVVKSWRDMKRSPYFFMRQQAAKRLQTYALTSFSLILVTLVTAAYTWQQPGTDTIVRAATLDNHKPASSEIRALVEAVPVRLDAAAIAETAVTSETLPTSTTTMLVDESSTLQQRILTLPAQYDRFEPTAEVTDDTKIGRLVFSTKIDSDYTAVNPTTIFADGFYTIYATFSYEGMRDGMAWSWVWRYEGEVVDGGNELWKYGADGPGYVYYGPEEGFQNGEYALEIWINGELFTRSTLLINSAAAAANN